MRLKLLAILALAAACFFAGQYWTLWAQPELMTDVALRQMEQSDEAAQLMRTANQAQQWPVLMAMFAAAAGVLVILLPSRRRR